MQDPSLPKVLYPLAGTPLIGHVLNLTQTIGFDKSIVIVGFGREQVIGYLSESFPGVQTAIQQEQLGTGHAVQQTESTLEGFDGDVVVLSGDVPLLTERTTRELITAHRKQNALATVLSVVMQNPFGYGRIVRTSDGEHLERIVEEKDATEAIRSVTEINSGIYVFDSKTLFEALSKIDRKNAQGEYYLTDVFGFIIQNHGVDSVAIAQTQDPIEVSGVNTKQQLEELQAEYLRRLELVA